MTDKKKKIILVGAVFAVTAVLFYILTYLTPMYADDYSYRYIFIVTENKTRVTNIRELIISQFGHYLYVNGRTVVHTLAQIFLMWGKPIFNFINTAAFLLLGTLIYYHGCGELQDIKPLRLAFIWLMLWVSTPAFGQSYLWLVGSCNYMYGPIIILLYLIPFTKNRESAEQINSLPLAVLYIFIGLLAGWTVENLSAAVIIITLCYIINDAIIYGKVPPWMASGLLGCIAGAALIVKSPGQKARIAAYDGIGGISEWIHRAVSITWHGGRCLIVPISIFIVFIILYILQNRDITIKKAFFELSDVIIFTLGTLASIYCMILSPDFPERTWSGPAILFTINLLLFARHIKPIKLKKWIKPCVCAIIAVVFTVSFVIAFKDVNSTYKATIERENVIYTQLEKGEKNIELEPICGKTKWSCHADYGDLVNDPDQWPNTALAMYYGADKIIRK